VLAAGQLGVKARTQRKQRSDAALRRDLTLVGAKNAGEALEHRGLTGAIGAQQSQGLTLRHCERDVAQRPELLGRQTKAHDALLERGGLLLVPAEELPHLLGGDGVGHGRYSSSAKSPDIRK